VTVAALGALAGLFAGCGSQSGSRKAATATIDVSVEAMSFQPSRFNVAAGQTVTFHFHNAASVVHEALIGNAAIQDKHEQEMRGMGGTNTSGMSGDNVVIVQPGATQTLVYHFAQPGSVIIGCHEPGHYAAGMRADVTVA
jgi:uncharacterized cupredoxin-like copper-binding protein